ncbi:hypothetical protein Avbf_04712 [Armadillidium vulgare]|nr:hypothetical protein Avbf_04712 [Armadillidium vulgare]
MNLKTFLRILNAVRKVTCHFPPALHFCKLIFFKILNYTLNIENYVCKYANKYFEGPNRLKAKETGYKKVL